MDLHRVWEFPPSIRVYDGDGFTEYVKKDIYTPKGKKTPIGRYEQSR